ncbi:hypothetical protein ACK389_10610 [Streptomyces antibioticus]|uniref:hypothetical protein n=1 Tax=Streptomyces TaxID=1883 RepID=UPI000A87C91D|nr:hypothetical protein [Streptomyces tanashiensis]GGT22243.1 hypothetical protein GCM10010222_75170 [Streptomyces tanashiensis]
MPATRLAPRRRDAHLTIAEQFHAFDAQNPHVYQALERLTRERLTVGATRISLKALFEALRWRLPSGVRGLNNNFTALYVRKLIAEHPEWATAFELRRRRTP